MDAVGSAAHTCPQAHQSGLRPPLPDGSSRGTGEGVGLAGSTCTPNPNTEAVNAPYSHRQGKELPPCRSHKAAGSHVIKPWCLDT